MRARVVNPSQARGCLAWLLQPELGTVAAADFFARIRRYFLRLNLGECGFASSSDTPVAPEQVANNLHSMGSFAIDVMILLEVGDVEDDEIKGLWMPEPVLIPVQVKDCVTSPRRHPAPHNELPKSMAASMMIRKGSPTRSRIQALLRVLRRRRRSANAHLILLRSR